MPHQRILIACIGNIFLGDDAFGVEVARLLARRTLPDGVEAFDYGIRSFDLAMALLGRYDDVIIVDAMPHGETPGTLYVLEPNVPEPAANGGAFPEPVAIETHGMGPEKVIRLAATLGGKLPRILVVGCEPTSFVADESDIMAGLSPPVQAAVGEAVDLIESLLNRLLTEHAVGKATVEPAATEAGFVIPEPEETPAPPSAADRATSIAT